MTEKIESISVLGSGVMGAQIAGHLANCGCNVTLLDLSKELVIKALEKLKKARPPALFTTDVLKKVTPGSIDEDLKNACAADWIIEVIPEKIEFKRDLYSKIEKHISNKSIVTSNTSGLSLSLLTEGRSEMFKKTFLITHFFNPVRFMKLVEVITGPDTDQVKAALIRDFLSIKMAKGVVNAKDTPGFIGNRIGVFMVMNVISKTIKNNWPIDLVDLVMGKAMAFAGSAIFRTADLVGIDTLLYVAKNTYDLCPSDSFRDALLVPPLVEKMVAEGSLGIKSGKGFYKKEGKDINVLDTVKNEYRPKERYKFESLKMAKKIGDPGKRIKAMLDANDDAAGIARELLEDMLKHVASVAGEIADTATDIDNAMKWGYAWELGPFEMWRAAGRDFAGGMPKGLKEARAKKKYTIESVKAGKEPVEKNAGASLIDLGDGIIACEFNTKMNAIDGDIIDMLNRGCDLLDENKFNGMLIANDSVNFSVGANLLMIAMAISSQSWDQIADLIDAFQNVGQRMHFSKKPVVAASTGMVLGGGCEVCLSAGNVVTSAETYMGLVELGVGLIPAGGGCKNLLLNMEAGRRALHNPKNKIWSSPTDGGSFPKVADAFGVIAMAKVSISGPDAVKIGYLGKDTKVVLDRDKLLEDAKAHIVELAQDYKPKVPNENISLPGRGGENALVSNIRQMRALEQITDFEVVLATGLAHILCGGSIATEHTATEQDILDLEKEVFLKLCGMKETAERIQHMLTTGKPLRN